MARITVEDCIDKFPSRFELVLVASNRARKLHSGDTPTVEKDNDKNTVIALREIADETISKEDLKLKLIEEYQTTTFSVDEDLDELDDNLENKELSVNDEDENHEIENFENQSNEDSSEDDHLNNNNEEDHSDNNELVSENNNH